MAVVTTTIAPTVSVFPLQIAEQLRQQNSGFPRAVVEAAYPTATYSPPGAGNNLQLFVNYELPKNYAYAYLGFVLSVGRYDTASPAAAANTFNPPSHTIFSKPIGGREYRQPVLNAPILKEYSTGTLAEVKNFADEPDTPTSSIIFNTDNETPEIKAFLYDDVLDTETGFVNYRARFLQYDISQAYSFPVNYSIPTR